MVEHIFADNTRTRETGLFEYPKLLLRLNEEFKDMKFKRIEYNSEMDKTTFKRDLTLIIKPRLSGWNTQYIELEYGNDEEKYLSKFLKEKKGFARNISYYRLSNNDSEPREKILFKYESNGEQKSIIIGDYLYDRNIVIIYSSFLKSELSLLFANDYLFWFVNFLKGWIKKNKIMKVNVTAKIQEQMLRQFRKHSADKISTFRNEISNNRKTIKDRNEQIVMMLKDNTEKKVMIVGLEKLVKITMGALIKEINQIKKLPFVKSVKLTSSGINVEVKDVRITYDKKVIKMGDYVITILPNQFKIIAKTPIERENDNALHHPHIDDGGGICFGNRGEKINNLLAEMKFSKLVYFLYLYLKSYNPNDKYNPISWWTKGENDGS